MLWSLNYDLSRLNFSNVEPNDFFNLLKPIKLNNLELQRYGNQYGDGGYILPNDLKNIEYLFSLGVGTQYSFEEDMNNRNIKCFLADYSVETSSFENSNLNFYKKYIKAYKNGEYGSASARERIFGRYKEIYNKRLKAVSFSEGVSDLQKKTNSIGNTKIKSEATQRLEEYKKTGSKSAMNDIIQLKNLDDQLGNKQEKVMTLFTLKKRKFPNKHTTRIMIGT